MLSFFIESRGLKAQLIDCKQMVMSVKQASEEMNCETSDVAKSIVFVDTEKNAFLAVVLGNDRVSVSKLEKILGAKKLEVATEKEVFTATGFEIGGVPPIGVFGVRTIIDKRVMEKETVFAGGGDEFHLLKISTAELLENAFEPSVEEIAE